MKNEKSMGCFVLDGSFQKRFFELLKIIFLKKIISKEALAKPQVSPLALNVQPLRG